MEKTKVFLSDPQILFREGIHFILSGEEDFEVIGETTNNEDAFAFIKDNPPHVAVLNMRDDKLDGAEATYRIKRNLPSVSVILVVDSDDEEIRFSAMKSGASACLTKDTDPEYLVKIIREAAQGSQPIIESLLIPGLASRVLIDFEDLAALGEQLNNALASLSPRETEVLKCLGEGNGIEQVAAKLGINEETIRHNLRLILTKLVANEQAKAVIDAVQRSFLATGVRKAKMGALPAEYVTKEEFNEFKESLTKRLKSIISESV